MRLPLLALWVPAIVLAQAPARPRIVLESLAYDFGPLAPNATATHRFKVSNAGGAPLTIAKLNPSCGCTSTVLGKKTLAPGESTELEVTFSAAGSIGPTRKSIQVVSNDPQRPVLDLTFTADVSPAVKADTDSVRFEDLEPSDQPMASVKVATATDRPLRLDNVQLSRAPWLGVVTREEGRELWVDFHLVASKLPPGKLSGTDTVTLQLSNPNTSFLKLTAYWEKRAPVIATPTRVAWSRPAGQELTTDLRLDSRDRKPFRILAARTSNPLVRLVGVSPKAASSQVFQVRLSAAAKAGVYEEKAFLTLDTPGHPELEIRVVASLH
jgi:hypothetical protein